MSSHFVKEIEKLVEVYGVAGVNAAVQKLLCQPATTEKGRRGE